MSKLLSKLFPGSKESDQNENPLALQGGTSGGAFALSSDFDGSMSNDPQEIARNAAISSADGSYLIRRMPEDRRSKYAILNVMAKDPTIDSALKMHITHALSAKPDESEIVSIQPADGFEYDDPILVDLRNTFGEQINKRVQRWGYKAALYGWCPVRIYGEAGKGVTKIRDDHYTHPYHTYRYERAGQLVGFSSYYQTGNGEKKGQINLMPPWSFCESILSNWTEQLGNEPVRQSGDIFDIADTDPSREGFVESSDYGLSIIETAYEPWCDLQEAILSLNMSRKNASVTDRLVGVNTGKLNPTKAAEYLRAITGQLKKTARAQADRSLKKGYIQTVWNNIFPIWGAGQGQVDISTIEGKPDIAYIEDIKFHINRLGSAVGVEPSLLGFGDMMSGGLGDGGFFRVSILAAMKAQAIRIAVNHMLDQLFEIHVAYKYNKVFLDKDKPWKIMFNSQSTAIAQELAAERDQSAAFAMTVTQIMQMMDPDLNNIDKTNYNKWVFSDLLKISEEKASMILKKIQEPDPETQDDEYDDDEDDVFESVGNKKLDGIKAMIYEILAEQEEGLL